MQVDGSRAGQSRRDTIGLSTTGCQHVVTDSLAAAREFLVDRVHGAGAVEQARLDALIEELLAVTSMAELLRALGDAAAGEHIAALDRDRVVLAERIAALLAAWRRGGGTLRLSSTGDGGDAPPDRPDTAAAIPDEVRIDTASPSVERDERPVAPAVQAVGAATPPVGLHSDVQRLLESYGVVPGADGPPAAVVDEPPSAEEFQTMLSRLQTHFAAGGLPGTGVAPPAFVESDRGALLARLRAVVADLSLPAGDAIPGGAWLDEVGRLEDGLRDLDERWGPLPAEQQRDLGGLFAAWARHLQDQTPDTADSGSRQRLDAVFRTLSQFMRTYWPGAVNGLARLHRPRGHSWIEDAHTYLRALREDAGLTEAGAARPAADGRATEVDLDVFLRHEGFVTEEGRAIARGALAAAKLSQPRKQRMLASKTDRARALFRDGRLRLCDDPACAAIRGALFGAESPVAAVERAYCDICQGSNNRRAALRLALRMRELGLDRLLVVGGSDDSRAELARLLGDYLELRLVVGAGVSRSLKDARADMNWAQVMVIWGGTELDHKVSNLYDDPPAGVVVVRLDRRGIEALANAVLERLDAG